jgi:hypothetical protein
MLFTSKKRSQEELTELFNQQRDKNEEIESNKKSVKNTGRVWKLSDKKIIQILKENKVAGKITTVSKTELQDKDEEEAGPKDPKKSNNIRHLWKIEMLNKGLINRNPFRSECSSLRRGLHQEGLFLNNSEMASNLVQTKIKDTDDHCHSHHHMSESEEKTRLFSFYM